MPQKILAKIDTVNGWNTLSLLSGIVSAGCLGMYLYLIS